MPKFSKNKVTYKVPVFDGGLNSKWTDLSCPPHMSPDLQQVQFTSVGAVGLAKGYTKLSSAAVGTKSVDGIHDLYVSASEAEYLLAVCSGSVHVTTATAFTHLSGSTAAWTSGQDVCIRTVEDEAWFTDGYNTAMRTDGSYWRTVGVSQLSASDATLLQGAGGALTTGATYIYQMSGVNEDGTESVPITFTTALNIGASNKIDLSSVPAFPASANVQTKNLYRNTAGADTIFYKVTALTAAQTTYSDLIPDSDLVTLAVTTSYPPPKIRWWWYHRGTLFGAGDPDNPMRMYYSKAGHPDEWPSGNYLDIGKGDGYPITGIRVVGNSVLIHKGTPSGAQASIWMVYMPDSTDATGASNWYIQKSPSAYATMSDKAQAEFENMVGFLDSRGMYSYNGESISPAPAVSQAGQYMAASRSENIDPNVGDWRKSLMSGSAMVAYDDKLWLAVPEGATAQRNNVIYVYDYSVSTKERGFGSWSKLVGPEVNNFTIFKGGLVAGSSEDGTIYNLDDGWTADGSDLGSYYFTATYAGNEKEWDITKVWRYLWLTVETPGSWDLTVDWWTDQASSITGTEDVSLTGSGSEWDEAEWDAGVWDSGSTRKTVRINLAGCVGRTIQFKFSNDSQEAPWKLFRMELEYNLRSRRD